MSNNFTRRYDYGVLACTARKHPAGLTPATLYRGALFSVCYRHALQRCDTVLVMSAKYGLLRPDDLVSYYDVYLGDLKGAARAHYLALLAQQCASLGVCKILTYTPRQHTAALQRSVLNRTKLSAPYADLGFLKQTAVISREIKNYGKVPSRR